MSEPIARSPARPYPGTIWSIGWYSGESPVELRSDPALQNPILTAADIHDVPAEFVADPFLVNRDGRWHMFFEVLNAETRRGVIGLAVSSDTRSWSYQGVVLEEPFHLSYPHVFTDGKDVYMTPETLKLGHVVLYRADPFPARWVREGELISGRGADPTPFRHEGRWWMFVCLPVDRYETLRLYFAQQLAGEWQEHPQSPIVTGDPRRSRPAGRVVEWDGRLLRFAQDCVPAYGTAVRGFEILELNESRYVERATEPEVVLSAGAETWNSGRVHHVDAHELVPGCWIACVDGTEPFVF